MQCSRTDVQSLLLREKLKRCHKQGKTKLLDLARNCFRPGSSGFCTKEERETLCPGGGVEVETTCHLILEYKGSNPVLSEQVSCDWPERIDG